MEPSLEDLLQMRRNLDKTWPSDLREDLREKEPQIYTESELIDSLIVEKKKNSEDQTLTEQEKESLLQSPSSPSTVQQPVFFPPKPSLVASKWTTIKKGKINWSDFQNLLFLYALGVLTIDNTPENNATMQQDTQELTYAVETFLPLKGQKMQTATERLKPGKSKYLDFGKKVIRTLANKSDEDDVSISLEIMKAEDISSFHADKLILSRKIAQDVFKILKTRYNIKN